MIIQDYSMIIPVLICNYPGLFLDPYNMWLIYKICPLDLSDFIEDMNGISTDILFLFLNNLYFICKGTHCL